MLFPANCRGDLTRERKAIAAGYETIVEDMFIRNDIPIHLVLEDGSLAYPMKGGNESNMYSITTVPISAIQMNDRFIINKTEYRVKSIQSRSPLTTCKCERIQSIYNLVGRSFSASFSASFA